jgi:gamma-carbonic anhydrase
MQNILPYKDTFPELAEGVFIAPGAWVIGDVVIGERSSIWFNTVVRGDVHYIRIGSETNIQDSCTLHVTGGKFPLEVGNRVTVGHGVILHGSVVEDDCLIGMGAIILDGCKIGKGSVIAAGSVLPPGFEAPPESMIIGSPAMVKKTVSDAQRKLHKGSIEHYLELAEDYLNSSRRQASVTIKGFLG